jgi:hypothetical protein
MGGVHALILDFSVQADDLVHLATTTVRAALLSSE